MVRDYSRLQDLLLLAIRWAVVGVMAYWYLEAPNVYVPVAVVGALGVYALVLTVLYVGAWAGTRGFAHLQSVGDLAMVAATQLMAPALAQPALGSLLAVAVLIGLRRFPWAQTAGYAAAAMAAGLVGQLDARDALLPVEPALAGLGVLGARFFAGDPLPDDFLERRPPVRGDQVRALQGLGHTVTERTDRQALVREAHRLLQAHTGGTRAAVVLLDEGPDSGTVFTVVGGELRSRPIVLEANGRTPVERVLREGHLRLTRQREPLPIVELLGERGASSFVGAGMRAGGALLGVLLSYDKEGGRPFTEQDEAFLDLLAPALAAALYNDRIAGQAEQSAGIFPHALLAMLALRRPDAEAHAEQIARFVEAIGEQMALAPDDLRALRLGALVHDVGELGVAGDPFNRTQMLTTEEYERIKEHPWIGARLLASLDQAPEVLDMVYEHHERWDGMGYPQQLARADISLGARIIAVADALDAITAERPYRAPRPVREALQELVANSGTQFDPGVVQALLAVVAGRGDSWVAAPPRRPKPAIEPWSGRVRRQ